jgi:hypothetical protein
MSTQIIFEVIKDGYGRVLIADNHLLKYYKIVANVPLLRNIWNLRL